MGVGKTIQAISNDTYFKRFNLARTSLTSSPKVGLLTQEKYKVTCWLAWIFFNGGNTYMYGPNFKIVMEKQERPVWKKRK